MLGVYYRAIFLCFLKNLPIDAAAEYCYATIDTIRGVYQFCRGQVSQFITELREDSPLCQLSNYEEGEEPECDIDESLFTRVRVESNIFERQVWIIGAIERKTKQIRCIATLERNTNTVMEFILNNISTSKERATRLYTDRAKYYSKLSEYGYQHTQVVHANGFGEGRETTNNIESLWAQLKRIGRFDDGWNFSSIQEVESSLNEVVWRWGLKHQEDNGYLQLAEMLENSLLNKRIKILNFN